jgi:hypothetical protein
MQQVEIRVKDHLDENWSKWLDGFAFNYPRPDETVLTGRVEDQAALYGVIAKLRDLGVKLLSVNFGEAKDNFLDIGDTIG